MHATMPEFSVRPYATVPVEGDAADLLNAVAGALSDDPHVLAPAVGYDYEKHQVDAIFQLDITEHAFPTFAIGATDTDAVTFARRAFDAALEAAGVDERTNGVAIVKGDDPDQLP